MPEWTPLPAGRPVRGPHAEGGEDGAASVSPPPPAVGAPSARRQQPGRPRPAPGRTTSRAELSRHPRFAELSPEVGVLDEAALESAVQQDPDAVLALLADLTRATDERLRAAALRLAGRLLLDRARTGPARSGGTRRLRAVPADRGGDLDVDASLDALLEARGERRPPSLEHLVARLWGRPATALVVLVDRSGSMAGERLAVAALVAAACALRAPEQHAVLAFAASVEVLRAVDGQSPPSVVVQAVLSLRGHGETGLTAALDEAAVQLGRTTAARKIVLLLSDCRVDPREDPLPAARRLPELVILAPAHDSGPAQGLARRAGASWAPVAGASEVPALLDRLLS
ncbi:MAG: VWA domain-containing protein [Frankiales bacterium]|nr:VWA domain-containing protein [Frankiales bacterium]